MCVTVRVHLLIVAAGNMLEQVLLRVSVNHCSATKRCWTTSWWLAEKAPFNHHVMASDWDWRAGATVVCSAAVEW